MVSAGLGLTLVLAATGGSGSRCWDVADSAALRFSLSCAELIPAPELRDVSGVLELQPPPSPFGVAVTAAGVPRYRLVSTVRGLPPPQRLGRAPGTLTTYIAWAATLSLDSVVKLGVLRNGRTDLGELARTQFRVIVTAEPAESVSWRSGPIMLRATSPGARLLAHRDRLQLLGASSSRRDSDAVHHDSLPWRMPAGMPMMPGMEALHPRVSPMAADAVLDLRSIPVARRREVAALRTGDTLDLEAGLVRRTIAGKTIAMYAFNGQYPGPLIQVQQGTTLLVRFHNRLDLPMAIHWHGVRVQNRFDGVPGLTQPPVDPGGSFVYRVHFRDAGVYWYHPHHREDLLQDLGLYGNLLVHSPAWADHTGINREEVLMLDDLLLDQAGLFPHGREAPTHALMGRFGNVFLMNGEPDYRLSVRTGETVRFLLTNASNTRIYNLSFGHAPMKLVGGDGGRLEREVWVSSVVLAPAERYAVEVRFPRAGRVALTNRVQALNHLLGTFSAETDTLGMVGVSPRRIGRDHGPAFARLERHAEALAELSRYRPLFDRPVDRELRLDLRTRGLPPAAASMLAGASVPVEWNDAMAMLNWAMTPGELSWILRDVTTGATNMDIRWRFTEGDVVKLRIGNEPGALHAMAHPIHLHGQRFLVVSRNGVRNEFPMWKDTALIPAGERVDLLVEMSNPGRWMLHCHIAEHLGAGMRMVFEVAPRH